MRIRSFSRVMRQPSRSPWPSRSAWAVIVIGALVFATVVVRNLLRHDALTEWRRDLETAAGSPAWPAWSPDWPSLPRPATRRHRLPQHLRGPYAYAAHSADVLQHIPCYCGCVREGHRSAVNCFLNGFRPDGTPNWTDHSFNCEMCLHIAREVMLMSSQGLSVQRIREQIDERYRALGQPTNTPLPSHEEERSRR
ncbi:MAG TPA: PCYCGC motif-containing (lipo)protein [Vicinamibacterales bacterium]|nr:PCYCGC motif-containing (lipo)protein [Vicinamibacterales bacterium]